MKKQYGVWVENNNHEGELWRVLIDLSSKIQKDRWLKVIKILDKLELDDCPYRVEEDELTDDQVTAILRYSVPGYYDSIGLGELKDISTLDLTHDPFYKLRHISFTR